MSFDKLIAKVAQAEDAVEAHERSVGADVRQLKRSWKAAWTPGRIVIAGLAAGFLVGRAQPLRQASRDGSVLRLVSLLSGLFASTTAASAAQDAEAAAATADAATATAAGAPGLASDDAALLAREQLAHEHLERAAVAARQAGHDAS